MFASVAAWMASVRVRIHANRLIMKLMNSLAAHTCLFVFRSRMCMIVTGYVVQCATVLIPSSGAAMIRADTTISGDTDGTWGVHT